MGAPAGSGEWNLWMLRLREEKRGGEEGTDVVLEAAVP